MRAVCVAVAACGALAGCGSDDDGNAPPAPTATAAVSATESPTRTATPMPSSTPTGTASATPPPTATPTATASPSATPTATATPTLPAAAPAWSAVHADGANTDYLAVPGRDTLALVWERHFQGSIQIGPLPWTINLGPTITPDGQVYLTSTVTGCHLQAIDGATGETRWCAPGLDVFAVASSPLIDRDGRLFIADGTAMHALDADGTVLWSTPIVGVPFSAQFTAEGRVLFITHIGRIYVLDRDTGAAMLPPVELIPGATWDPSEGIFACAVGTAACPSANTPAIDAPSGRFYFTFWAPGAEQAGLRAMRYREEPVPAITDLWTNDTLPGGSASSPVLSPDGARVYVNDYVDAMHALDAVTGAGLWRVTIGFASGGSPSLSPAGIIMPAGGGTSPLLAVRDHGDRGEIIWRRDDLLNRGIATQVAGDRVYATIGIGGGRNDLVIVDALTGDEIDRQPIPGISAFTVGTTVGLDGTVYVPSIVGGLYAYR